MRYLTLFFSIIAFSVSISAQTETISTYKVTNYSIDGVKYDNVALDEDLALSFYLCDDDQLCLANEFRKTNSQSYGGVFGLKSSQIEETDSTYASDVFQFTWDFANTYDAVTGKASVTMTQVYIGNTIKLIAQIVVLETNQVLDFVGYLEEKN